MTLIKTESEESEEGDATKTHKPTKHTRQQAPKMEGAK